MSNTIERKAAAIAESIGATTQEILARMSKLDSQAVERLQTSGIMNEPYVSVFLFFYYRTCDYLARCVNETDPIFGDDESPEAQDVAQYACIFCASMDLEEASGGGPEYWKAMRKIMDNQDLALFLLAAYICYVQPARPPLKTQSF